MLAVTAAALPAFPPSWGAALPAIRCAWFESPLGLPCKLGIPMSVRAASVLKDQHFSEAVGTKHPKRPQSLTFGIPFGAGPWKGEGEPRYYDSRTDN